MTVRPRRSALYLPASNARAIEKARSLDSDVIILDLEDAVSPEAKADARDAAVLAAREGGFGHRELVIRVNDLDTEWGEDDLRAASSADCDAILLPKVSDVVQLHRARSMLRTAPHDLWAMIETPAAMLRLSEIGAAAKDVGLTTFVAGTNDLAKDMRCQPDTLRTPLLPLLIDMVVAARAFGLTVLDGVCNDFDDLDVVERECLQGVQLGFDGKTLIHPRQISIANAAYSPKADEIEWASKIVAAFAEPENAGKGAIRLDGRMVELLHRDRAEQLLRVAQLASPS